MRFDQWAKQIGARETYHDLAVLEVLQDICFDGSHEFIKCRQSFDNYMYADPLYGSLDKWRYQAVHRAIRLYNTSVGRIFPVVSLRRTGSQEID